MVAYFFTSVIPFHYPLYPLLKNPIPRSPPSQSRSLRSPEAAKRSVPLRSTSLAAINPAPQEPDQPFGLTPQNIHAKKRRAHTKNATSAPRAGRFRLFQESLLRSPEPKSASQYLKITRGEIGAKFAYPRLETPTILVIKRRGQEAFPKANGKAPSQGSRGVG
jgi:hypothetical protein